MRAALLSVLALSACTDLPVPVTPATGASYTAINTLVVTSTGPETFHVAYGGLIGDSDFWCAAGDYVIHWLHRPISTMVYRLSPPPRHAGQGIDFTLNAADAQPSGITTFGATSPGFRAGGAVEFCEPPERIMWP